MKLHIARDIAEWARIAADTVMETVAGKPRPVFILPTGSTPLPLYAELVRRHAAGVSFAHVTTFNLDEYIGLPAGHPEGYRAFMKKNLFDHIDIPEGQWHIPDGLAADPDGAAARYDAALEAAGGADLAVLGVGHNGHIGFNEPGTPANSRTHVAELSEKTRRANARFFSSIDEVPSRALTLGLGNILSARRILLMARGADKADIIREVLRGPVTTLVPGSLLKQHADVTVVLDEAAAAGIQ
ncbi:MAG: glucosamine-6-phosphate deaminase [Clostridiales bacterium]|nr:glucosamine-6-phosphate deaminase [Clostridiales bacterium]